MSCRSSEPCCLKRRFVVEVGLFWQEAGGGEAVEAEAQAAAGFAVVDAEYAREMVFRGPMRGVGAPVDVEIGLAKIERVDDEGGAGKMAGRTDDFGGV